ncbi:hypothetical protein GCM10009555_031690 [Acrocarpospora macrocephala]|uniref:Uncharacterized protein n=1 Tax=Acrocarpospora macrocephala TaxID=150177 RepID=A0A5M3WUX4_9ACTN|nr:hypothetical protein Amac_060970 [Acrocarpospora macrocephala]
MDDEDTGHVGADPEEGRVPDGDLSGEAGQQVEPGHRDGDDEDLGELGDPEGLEEERDEHEGEDKRGIGRSAYRA